MMALLASVLMKFCIIQSIVSFIYMYLLGASDAAMTRSYSQKFLLKAQTKFQLGLPSVSLLEYIISWVVIANEWGKRIGELKGPVSPIIKKERLSSF
jgi:hypothetical protein